jgi:hypothetical protein
MQGYLTGYKVADIAALAEGNLFDLIPEIFTWNAILLFFDINRKKKSKPCCISCGTNV